MAKVLSLFSGSARDLFTLQPTAKCLVSLPESLYFIHLYFFYPLYNYTQ